MCKKKKKNVNKFTDKQLVELMHVRAVDILGVHAAASLRYQSVTLFLRGKCTFCILNYPFLLCHGLETLLLNQP